MAAAPSGPAPTVIVAGLGPADATLMPPLVRARLGSGRWWLRTLRHPAASEVDAVGSFDSFYDDSDTFEHTYERIAAALIADATEHGVVGYAVPGSALVLERTVELLGEAARRGEIQLDVLPAMSFLDLAWAVLGVDPVTAGVRLVDGHRFATDAAGERGPLLVAHAHSRAVLSDIKLAVLDQPTSDPDGEVHVLHHLGLADQRVSVTTWADLDRGDDPDHLTTLWVPHLNVPVASSMQRLSEVVAEAAPRRVDQARPAALANEIVAAAGEVQQRLVAFDDESGEGAEPLCEALGRVLGGVAGVARLGEAAGWFSLADIADVAASGVVAVSGVAAGRPAPDPTGPAGPTQP